MVSLKVLGADLPEDRTRKNYRFSPLTEQRLRKLRLRLGQTETAVLELAVIHLLGSLERDQAVWMTAPSEPQSAPEEEGA